MAARPGERGQATAEYTAVVLVLALVLLVAGTIAAARGGGVGDAVVRQVVRALCIVTGGDCDREREPCVVGASTWRRDVGATVVVARVGSDRTVVRERLSDGSVVVTYAEGDVGGLDADAGVGLRVAIGKRALRVGGEVGAALLARMGSGRVWVVDGDRQASALVERLRRGRWTSGVPTAAKRFEETGASVDLGASAGAGVTGALGISAADTWGSRVETATGRRTFYLRRATTGTASVTVRDAAASADAAGEEEYAVTVDRDGRAVDLAVLRHGRLGGSADLPSGLLPVAGRLAVPSSGERLWVTETHLDLTDARNAAAAGAFLDQVRAPRPRAGAAVDVSRGLAERLDRAGIVHARTYALDTTASGLDVEGALAGIKGGLTWRATEGTSRLLAAITRGRDGSWVTRDDCLGDAARA